MQKVHFQVYATTISNINGLRSLDKTATVICILATCFNIITNKSFNTHLTKSKIVKGDDISNEQS